MDVFSHPRPPTRGQEQVEAEDQMGQWGDYMGTHEGDPFHRPSDGRQLRYRQEAVRQDRMEVDQGLHA